jgi:DNA-binding NtrC family response regulator
MAATDTSIHRILIADDQSDVLEALHLLLKAESYQIETVKSPAAVIKALEARDFSLVLMDLNYERDTTSGQEGLDLLKKIQTIDSSLPVVVMTAWASVDVAVEAMRRGARDFITKPWDNPRLVAIVRNQIDLGNAVRAYRRLEQENQLLRGKGGPNLIAQSAAMRPVLEIIARVGPSPLFPSTWAGCPRACSRANSSATCAARLPMPRATGPAALNSPTAARCSWTRSATFR